MEEEEEEGIIKSQVPSAPPPKKRARTSHRTHSAEPSRTVSQEEEDLRTPELQDANL